MVALTVLKVPRTSMSMTVLKALGERPSRGAMKLPAAPALLMLGSERVFMSICV